MADPSRCGQLFDRPVGEEQPNSPPPHGADPKALRGLVSINLCVWRTTIDLGYTCQALAGTGQGQKGGVRLSPLETQLSPSSYMDFILMASSSSPSEMEESLIPLHQLLRMIASKQAQRVVINLI